MDDNTKSEIKSSSEEIPTGAKESAPSATEQPARTESAERAARMQTSEEFGRITKHRLPWGVAGVFAWLLLFSIGVLIPAEPSRINLGWTPYSDMETQTKKLAERITEIENKPNNPTVDKQDGMKAPGLGGISKPNGGTTSPAPGSLNASMLSGNTDQVRQSSGTQTEIPEPKQDKSSKKGEQNTAKDGLSDAPKTGKFWSFVVATFTFTPLNVGFLCVLAAFIGGCSINKNEIHRIHQEILDLEANPPVPPNPDLARLRQRLDYLTEHPGYSTIRGLVVYLIIISGLFIIGAPLTGENGSQSVTLAQYMKLAGLFSFFGYLSGYDPTVFTSFIGLGSNHLNNGKKNP